MQSKSKRTWKWEEVPWDWDVWTVAATKVSRTSRLSARQLLTAMDRILGEEDLDCEPVLLRVFKLDCLTLLQCTTPIRF